MTVSCNTILLSTFCKVQNAKCIDILFCINVCGCFVVKVHTRLDSSPKPDGQYRKMKINETSYLLQTFIYNLSYCSAYKV